MNKNNYINDEKIADEESICKMNREYRSALKGNNLARLIPSLHSTNSRKPNICMPDYELVARAYFLEKDILTSLRFLLYKARQNTTKRVITNIIAIKERCAKRLLSLYVQGTSHVLEYAPNIINRPTYAMLYEEISYMQCELLMRLRDIPRIYQIRCDEHTASMMLYYIKP